MRKRILIVDDERANRVLLQAMLAPLDCETIMAVDGEEALEQLERQSVDLVLLDVMMPRVNGLDVLKRIRSRVDQAWVPVILVTAHNDREVRLEGLEAGADEFAEKPIDRALLTARVRTLLRLHEAQEQLEQRAEALEALDRERRELMNFIVHDMKNPLSVIRMNLLYVREASVALAPDEIEALADASRASDRMTTMVHDLLTIERMEHASLTLSLDSVDVAELVRDVVRTHHQEAAARNLEVSVSGTTATVEADRALLRRLIENLLENALKHTPKRGAIELCVEPGETVSVRVSNSGASIPEAIRDTLFEKFVQGDHGGRGRVGLGLYFCKRVAHLHHGSLSLVEREGWPVSFCLELPLRVSGGSQHQESV